MSLFNTLLRRLHHESIPEEDFFTEIVAYLLNADPQLACAWLRKCKVLESDQAQDENLRVRVTTQVNLQRLKDHDHDCDTRIGVTQLR